MEALVRVFLHPSASPFGIVQRATEPVLLHVLCMYIYRELTDCMSTETGTCVGMSPLSGGIEPSTH